MRPHGLPALALITAILSAVLIPVALSAQTDELEWSSAERDNLTLWHTQGQLRADALADHGQGAYDLVSDLIDVSLDDRVNVIVWPQGLDPADPTLLPDGVTPESPTLHVTRNSSGDVRNAIANALLDAATGPHADAVPLWMRFAMGLWSQGPLPAYFLTRAGSVVIFDHEQYYTIEQLEILPLTFSFQAKYFDQASGMLAWFIQDWGPETLAELFRTVGEGLPFYEAVRRIYGIPREKLIAEFTNNAERIFLLNWPYIESQQQPFYERLNLNHVILVAAAIPVAILLFFIAKRLFYD